jgi:hydrogenase maturation protease
MALADASDDVEDGVMETSSVPGRATRQSTRVGPQVNVEILVCGSAGRGDDGAGPAVVPLVQAHLPPGIRLRVVGQLDIDDLLGIPTGAGVVIADAASGIPVGQIVTMPLDGLIDSEVIRPRSSRALAFPEVIGFANMLRGKPLRGEIVAIGARRFGPGTPLSRRVAIALPALADAILRAAALVQLPVPTRHPH